VVRVCVNHALAHMGRRFLSFDVETTGLMCDEEELPELLCAAALVVEVDGSICASYAPMTWPAMPTGDSDIPARVMNGSEVLGLVAHMWSLCGDPAVPEPERMRVLAWNGIGYDLCLLYKHCQRFSTAAGIVAADRVSQMALASCDPMLNFTYRKGFPVKLSAAAKALSLPMSKTGEGAECAMNWMTGDRTDRVHVLEYCANDVVMTAAIFQEMQRTGSIKWVTRSGKRAEWRPPANSGELAAPCSEVMTWTFANNDFMRSKNGTLDWEMSVPCPESFVGWLREIYTHKTKRVKHTT
jgi:hypothetical protein